MSGFQVAPGRDRGRAARPPRRRRLRGVRRARRAGRRGAGGRGPARARLRRQPRTICSGSSPTRSPPTSGCTTSSSSTPSRGRRRARCCAAPSATSGRRRSPRRHGDRADGRPPLARAGRAARLGRAGGRPPRRRTASPSSTTASAPAKLDAAVAASGWRELRTPTDDGTPVGLGASRSPSSPRSSAAAWPTPPFLGPTLAAELRRLAGAPAAGDAETVALAQPTWRGRPTAERRRGRRRTRSLSTHAAPRRRCVLVSDGGGRRTVGAVALAAPRCRGVDLTRPVARCRAPETGRAPSTGQARPLDADDVARWHSLGLAVTCADLVGVMRGALDAGHRLRPRAPAVRRGHRVVPGRAAPAGRRLRGHGGLAQHRPARRLGRRRAAAGPTRSRPRRPPRPTAPAPPASVCETADSGARWHRQHLGVPRPRLPAPGPPVDRRARRRRAQPATGCWPRRDGIGGDDGLR